MTDRQTEFYKISQDPGQERYPDRLFADGSQIEGLSKMRTLNVDQRSIEWRIAHKFSQNWDDAIDRLLELSREKYGIPTVIDTEFVLHHMSDGYFDNPDARRVFLPALIGSANEVSIHAARKLWSKEPEGNGPKQNTVLYLMGPGGSGKKTAIRKAIAQALPYHAYFPRVTSQWQQLFDEQKPGNIQQILASGKNVDLYLVLTKPEDLFLRKIASGLETGQIEPLHQVALRWADCLDIFQYAHTLYQQSPDPRVHIGVVVNTDSPEHLYFFDGDPTELISEVTKGIPGYNPKEGLPGLKKALLDLAYNILADYDKANPAGTPGHLHDSPHNPWRAAIAGSKEEGLQHIHTAGSPYSSATIAVEGEKDTALPRPAISQPVRPSRARRTADAVIRWGRWGLDKVRHRDHNAG